MYQGGAYLFRININIKIKISKTTIGSREGVSVYSRQGMGQCVHCTADFQKGGGGGLLEKAGTGTGLVSGHYDQCCGSGTNMDPDPEPDPTFLRIWDPDPN
jgi:hypothetical protein